MNNIEKAIETDIDAVIESKHLSRVLNLDLGNLTEEEFLWIHELKNKAAVMTGRLQLKHMREAEEVLWKS